MKKARPAVPQKTRDEVLAAFNHRCAICGEDRPQLHHIDENPANNDPQNLIPLCPNCHLSDHHDPTRPIDPRKLALFRQYRDPTILTPQFEALFRRLVFLDAIGDDSDVETLKRKSEDLATFIEALAMGAFYGKQVRLLIHRGRHGSAGSVGDPVYEASKRQAEEEWSRKYREQLCINRSAVYNLAIELLRFQDWRVAEHTKPKSNNLA